MADKLSTEEILAQCRKADAGGSAPASQETPETEAAAVEETPAAKPKAPAATPSSTADILAAARAQGGGNAVKKDDNYEVDDEPEVAAAAPKKPAAKPGSTADILAAARSQGSGAAEAKPKTATAKPAAKEPAAKTSPKAPTGAASGLSVQEMLKGMREGKPAAQAETKAGAAAAKPKLPPKLPLPPKKAGSGTTRRGALMAIVALVATPFALAWTVLALITVDWTLYLARFMFPNVLVEPPTQFKIGPAGDYPFGTVSTKWKALRGIWIIHTDQYEGRDLIYALASVCTHLGCTPNWLDAEQKFKCPCHGSGFYMSGINFEGPAPRPLERVGLRVAEDGSLEVDKSVKFQQEMGQWEDAASFVDGTIA